MAVWYYSQNGQPVGPFDEAHMFAMAAKGLLKQADPVWCEGMPQWMPAGQAGLFQAPPGKRPPPVPGISAQAQAHAEAGGSRQMLEGCRASLGPTPRSLTMSPYLELTPAQWMQKFPQEAMWEIFRQQQVLWRHGKVVWGCMVQANSVLFSDGKNDAPASIIYSTDASFDGDVERLTAMAHALGEAKGKEHRDPEMAAFSAMLVDGKERGMRTAVPKSVRGGLPVFHTSVMVVRRHLPRGYLTQRIFPVLIEPPTTPAVIIVPSCYWPPALVQMWESRVS